MLVVPRLQTLMVGADGDGMEGYVLKRYPEPHGQVTAYNRSPVH